GIVAENQVGSADVEALKAVRAEAENGYAPNTPVFEVAADQLRRVAAVVTGANAVADVGAALAAESTGRQAVADAGKKLADAKSDVKLPANNLVGVANALTTAVLAREGQIAQLQQQLQQANAALAAKTEEITAVQAQNAKAVEEVRTRADQTASETQAALTANTGKVEDIEKTIDEERKTYATNLETKDNEIAALTSKNQQMQKELERIQQRLAGFRGSVDTQVVRQADGRIVRLAGDDICYVDLGSGDQVSPGLTFEVYDKFEGVPAPGATDETAMPVGKASLEVIRVGPTSSECRVVRTEPGKQLTEGDLVANLVFDRNTQYSFLVYGNFDLDQNNLATAAESDVVRRLVSQWGGRLAEQVNVDTDFVVMGKEPVLPSFTKEDLDDPINRKRLDDATAELNAYQEVLNRARDLHIPVMNQNRFLYYVGYYDQSRR
ncbi:MAG TPA: hypothetical protein VK324_17585, partial [Tepidisphaeraceae bacterium]|nr:hypothetical protein [Tepidisphaeraceae bacterium]